MPASSSEKLGSEVLEHLRTLGVEGNLVRIVDHDVRLGVRDDDEGDGDEWPAIRRQVLDADNLVLATPIWMGQPGSVPKKVVERLDNEIAETDDDGRPVLFGKVALVAVVDNEDGAHHTSAELFQALDDVGYSIPPAGRDLLSKRGHAVRRLPGPRPGAREDPRHHTHRCRQRRAPRRAPEGTALPGTVSRSAPTRQAPGVHSLDLVGAKIPVLLIQVPGRHHVPGWQTMSATTGKKPLARRG